MMIVLSWVLLVITLFTTRKNDGILGKTTAFWPSGSYGLPKPTSGCPKSEDINVSWREGWREQDMEDNKPRSQFSPNFHMDANLTNVFDIRRSFCIKETNQTQNSISWPKGSYCIYKYGNCSVNMTSGSIEWDDEDIHNLNERFGTIPSGNYGHDTTIYFCCQNQGHWYKSIVLPTDIPFYLLPLNAPRCQRVKWALSSLEYIIYDTEDDDNRDRFNESHAFSDKLNGLPKIYYCYYYGCRHRIGGNATGSLSSAISTNDQYPDYQYCSWLITVNQGLVVQLKFRHIQVPDCQENYIDFYDGSNMTSPLLGRLCSLNATVHSTLISTGNNLFLVFKTGNNSERTQKVGFIAEYNALFNPEIPTEHELRSTLTPQVQSSTDESVKYNDEVDTSNSSTPIIPIILPIFAVVFVLILISITFFYRRMKQIKNIVHRTNPSYDIRTNVTLQEETLSRHEAPYENSQEMWRENQRLSQECQNPIYELETETNLNTISTSGNNVADEPTYEQIDELCVKENIFYRTFDECGVSSLTSPLPPRSDDENNSDLPTSSNEDKNMTEEELSRCNAADLCKRLPTADSKTQEPGDVIYYNIPATQQDEPTEYHVDEEKSDAFPTTNLEPQKGINEGNFDAPTFLAESEIRPEEPSESNETGDQPSILISSEFETPEVDSEVYPAYAPISLNKNEIMSKKEQSEHNTFQHESFVHPSTDSETLVRSSEISDLCIPVISNGQKIAPKEAQAEYNASLNEFHVLPSTNCETLASGNEISDVEKQLNSSKTEVLPKKDQVERNPSQNQSCVLSLNESETLKRGSKKHSNA